MKTKVERAIRRECGFESLTPHWFFDEQLQRPAFLRWGFYNDCLKINNMEDLYGEKYNGVHEIEVSPRNNYGEVE
jgi:hypothetical protein